MADNILKEAREAFAEAQDHARQNYADAIEDLRFARLGKQWPDKIVKQRTIENRPCLTINKLSPVLRQVVNDARMNRPSIKVHPVDDTADPETAEVIGGLIRNIEASSNADVAYDTAVEHAVGGGFGFWRIDIDYSNDVADGEDLDSYGNSLFEQDIKINRVANPQSVYGDPWSTAVDSSDWNTAFVIEELSQAAFKRKHKNAKMTDFDGGPWSEVGDPWKTGEKVMRAEYWKRSETVKQAIGIESDGVFSVVLVDELERLLKEFGPDMVQPVTQPRPIKCHKVKQYVLSGVEILDENDWIGKYIPIVPVYGDEVNEGGKRHFRSLIRDAKDAQMMFNYWRTTATEVVALAPRVPFIGPKGAFKTDARKWNTANSHSHAFIEYDGGQAPQRESFAGVPAGMIQEALNASDDIKAITGIYDASLGARSNETSGRAIMARQREGDVSTFHFIDNLTRAIRHTGKIMIDLLPKVYTTERIVRILGEDGTPETKPLNKEYEAKQDKDGNPIMAMHDIRVGKYDIVVSSGPSFTTRREEAATQMIELIRSYPDAAPIIGDLLAKNLDWPGADEIAKRLKKMLPPNIREDDDEGLDPAIEEQIGQMTEAIQVLGQKLKEAEDKKDLEIRKILVSEYQAETARMKELAPVMSPEDIQALVFQTVQQLMTPTDLPEGEEEGMYGATGMEPDPEYIPAE